MLVRAYVGEVDRNAKTTSNHVQHVIKVDQALPPLFFTHAREESLERGYEFTEIAGWLTVPMFDACAKVRLAPVHVARARTPKFHDMHLHDM